MYKRNFFLPDPDDVKDFSYLHGPSEGFLFVVTYGRSGSTLLQNLLNAIPGYCIRGENAYSIYHLCRLIDNLQREDNIQARRDQVAGKEKYVPNLGQAIDPWYGAELIDVNRLAKGLFNVFCRDVLSMPPQVRVGGFKEIRYISDLAFLPRALEIIQTYFPRAKIIFLTRDHGMVSRSSWWRNVDQTDLLNKLCAADKSFSAYANSHADCFEMDYSSYAVGADAMAPLFDFLQERLEKDVVTKILNHQLLHMKGGA